MQLAVTPIYAAILAFFFIAASFYVSFARGKTGVRLGDGGNLTMLVAIRRHGNMAEFVPIALLMMAFGELTGLSATWLHICGVLLLVGRVVHPFGITEHGGPIVARVVGQLRTYAATLIPAVVILLRVL